MKSLKFWYVACIIFCIYSLNTLVNDLYNVYNLPKNRNETEPIIVLACKEFSSFRIEKREIDLRELRGKLYNHFSRSKDYSIERLRYGDKFKRLFLNPVEIGNYLIFNGQFCFFAKDAINEGEYIRRFLPQLVFYSFKNSTADFVKMVKWIEKFDQLIVLKERPYSDCSENSSRFRCLNECFKSRFRLSRYFYDVNETGHIHLPSSMNRSIEENESNCFRKCQRENCKMVQFVPIPIFDKERESQTTTLEVRPKLSEFDFWVQLFSLVCSFVNFSLNQFASMVIEFASLKVKRRKARIGLVYLKWILLLLSLSFCGYLWTMMILEYKAEEGVTARKEITWNNIKQKDIHLVICVPIYRYLNQTLPEIEKATDRALDDELEGIYLNYQERMFKVHYIVEPKVLFKYIRGLRRCFSLFIYPNYQMTPSNPKLTIKFMNSILLYLLTENENLNEKTFEYSAKKTFMKRIEKRLKSSGKCVDYQERYANCASRLHCVARCINLKLFREFKNITFDRAVVDRDQFSPTEWNSAYLMEISTYNASAYDTIRKRCFKEISDENPCTEIKFEKTVEIIPAAPKTLQFDLSLDVALSIEERVQIPLDKLLLNLMEIQTIFFGLSVLKLLRMLYNFLKPKFKIRNDRIALFFVYLLCSLGFIWHAYRIFEPIINEELTYNPNYEIAKRVQMPVMAFCLPVDEKLIDRNHKLTGNYLEQLTIEMSAESVFESITYLSDLIEWKPLVLNLEERFFFLNWKCIRFRIDQEYDRNQFHFSASSQTLEVLKVNFSKSFMNPQKKFRTVLYFMTKTNKTEKFSKTVSLDYDYRFKNFRTPYSVDQSELTVNYEDRFGYIKRLLSTVYEDDFRDLNGQLPELKSSEYDFGTLKNPLKKDDFDFELQDDLFDQLFSQVQNITTQNSLNNLDYQQTFVVNHLRRNYGSKSDFTFSLVLIKKTLLAENEKTFTQLVLDLLYLLVLWFDLGILDLHPFFDYFRDYLLVWLPICLLGKITQFLFVSRKWLKKLKPPLYERLKPRKQSPGRTRRF